MSLDVSLLVPRELSEDEVERLAAADLCEENGMKATAEFLRSDIALRQEVFSANITHNLAKMAGEAGLYDCLWRPDESGLTQARQLIEPMRRGLALLQSEPARFRALNPSNGWGNYEVLVRFVTNCLAACEDNPEATVEVSR